MIVVFSTLPSTVERTPKRDLADIDLVRIIWTDRDDVVEAELPVARRRWQLAPAIAAILGDEQPVSSIGVEPGIDERQWLRKAQASLRTRALFGQSRRWGDSRWTPVRSVDLKMPWLENAT
jgi:hypothetical protein